MKTIDIYGDNPCEQFTKVREACRGIVIKGDKILLTYEVNTDQWFIPGGGLEKSETLEVCCARELAEETGCVVKVNEQFLTINEFYEEWLFISHYFVCNYIGETHRTLTEREEEDGLEPRWIALNEAVNIFAKHQEYSSDNKMKSGAYLREYKALLTYMSRYIPIYLT